MRFWIVLALLVGCGPERVPQGPTEDKGGGYQVETLFEHDGCTMYRFQDKGYPRYWSRCPCGSSTISEDVKKVTSKCGKSTCTRTTHTPVEIPTTMEVQ